MHPQRTRRLQRGRHGRRLLAVHRVARTQTGDPRATGGERLGHRLGIHRRGPVRRLDTARLEQIGGERHPRGVRRDRAQRGEEDLGAGAARRQLRIGARPQLLEGVVPAHPRQPSADRRGRRLAVHRRLGEMRELADTGDRFAPVREVLGTALPGVGQPAGDHSGAQCRGLAAGPLDLLEPRPGRPGQLIGEALHVPGAARRVDHLRQMRLLQQHGLGVAGDPPRERVGQAQRGVERQHRHRVGAPHARGQPGDRGAQHVHPRVPTGHHHRGGDRVLALRGRGGEAPHTSATRAHSRRAARSLAIVRNWSAVAA